MRRCVTTGAPILAACPAPGRIYEEIDHRFFVAARDFLPEQALPFDALIPFAELRDRDILEIGVGQGSHAQLLSSHGKSYTGIDLTPHATEMTARRLRLFDLPGQRRANGCGNARISRPEL